MPAKKKAANSAETKPKPPFPVQYQKKPGRESALRPRPQYQAPDYRSARKLESKVALVTGGDSGIGRAVAFLFAREGADVAFRFLSSERADADETRRAIEATGRLPFSFNRGRRKRVHRKASQVAFTQREPIGVSAFNHLAVLGAAWFIIADSQESRNSACADSKQRACALLA